MDINNYLINVAYDMLRLLVIPGIPLFVVLGLLGRKYNKRKEVRKLLFAYVLICAFISLASPSNRPKREIASKPVPEQRVQNRAAEVKAPERKAQVVQQDKQRIDAQIRQRVVEQ